MFAFITRTKTRTTVSFETFFRKDPMAQVAAVEGVASASIGIVEILSEQSLAEPAAGSHIPAAAAADPVLASLGLG